MNDIERLDTLVHASDERVRLVAHGALRAVALRAGRRRFTGILWRPGLVVTADEALPEGEPVHVVTASGTHLVEVAGRDASTDVAVLRRLGPEVAPEVTAPSTASPGASSTTASAAAAAAPAVGGSILVVAAGDDGPVVAGGLIASVGPEWRSLRGGRIDARVELDVRLPRIAEGAPVFDVRGALLGMAVSGPRRRALLIPSATIERVAAALEHDGHVARGRIGAALQAIALDGGGRGLVVASVEADGPAARAGLHQGDLVVRVDGDESRGLRGIMSRLGPGTVGDTLVLTVRRGGEDREIAVEVEERAPG